MDRMASDAAEREDEVIDIDPKNLAGKKVRATSGLPWDRSASQAQSDSTRSGPTQGGEVTG